VVKLAWKKRQHQKARGGQEPQHKEVVSLESQEPSVVFRQQHFVDYTSYKESDLGERGNLVRQTNG